MHYKENYKKETEIIYFICHLSEYIINRIIYIYIFIISAASTNKSKKIYFYLVDTIFLIKTRSIHVWNH